MKRTAIGLMVLALVGCGKNEVKTVEVKPIEIEKAESVTTASVVTGVSKKVEMTPAQAQKFTKDYLKKIVEKEQFVKDAASVNDTQALFKASMEQPIEWPDTEALDPYTKCDMAFRDLSILAGSAQMLIKTPNAALVKINRDNANNYAKSKAECTQRANMTPEAAIKAEQNS